MSSTDINVDLSDDAPNAGSEGVIVTQAGQRPSTAGSANTGRCEQQSPQPPVSDPTTSSGGLSVNLDKQTLSQRRIVFGTTLTVCGLMFGAFGYFFFCSHFFRILIAVQPYAGVLGMAMLVIPSFLLWGLVRAVYKVGSDTEKTSDEFIKELRRLHPGA